MTISLFLLYSVLMDTITVLVMINIKQFIFCFSDKKSGTLVLICELMDMNIYELIRGK